MLGLWINSKLLKETMFFSSWIRNCHHYTIIVTYVTSIMCH